MAERTISTQFLFPYLRGVSYPASRDDLVAQANLNVAPEEIVRSLQHLPERTYHDLEEVAQGLTEAAPHHGTWPLAGDPSFTEPGPPPPIQGGHRT